MTQELQDKLKIVIEWLGGTFEQCYSKIDYCDQLGIHAVMPQGKFFPNGQRFTPVEFLKYHTSWEWQIPVWAKLVKQMNSKKYNAIIGDEIEYYKCILAERPDKGFEIIVSIIQRIQ